MRPTTVIHSGGRGCAVVLAVLAAAVTTVACSAMPPGPGDTLSLVARAALPPAP